MEKLEQLVKDLAAFGKRNEHPTVPGVQIAWLGKEWYVALHTYTEKFGNGKELLAKSRNVDLNIAIEELLVQIPIDMPKIG